MIVIKQHKYGNFHNKSVTCFGGRKSLSTRGYNLSRSQKNVTVQEINCGQVSVSGCNGHYKFVLRAGAKAKSVTNNLPILSVLAAALIYFYSSIVSKNQNKSRFFNFSFVSISHFFRNSTTILSTFSAP